MYGDDRLWQAPETLVQSEDAMWKATLTYWQYFVQPEIGSGNFGRSINAINGAKEWCVFIHLFPR